MGKKPTQKQIDDFKLDARIAALIKAASGMTTKQAVAHIEHGAEIKIVLGMAAAYMDDGITKTHVQDLLAKLEVK